MPPYAGPVPSLLELVRSHTDLDEGDVGVLQLLMADWQIIADLSLRRPGAVAARPRGRGLLGGRPDAADDRPHGVRRRHRRQLRPGRAAVPARPGATPTAGWSARATPSGATTCRCGSRRSRCRRGGPRDRGGRPQHQPARRAHAQPAGAVLPADRRRPDRDDRRPATSRPTASAATTPTRPASATASSASTSAGRVDYASPNALSVYRRLGLVRRPRRARPGRGHALRWCRPRRRPDEETLSAVLGGRAHLDTEIGDDAGVADRARDPAAAGRRAHRRAGAGARRHRPAPPRPRAGHQGRDHPRDPPPGEEQPADRRGAAAAPGAPDRLRRGASGAGGGGTPGGLDRDRARDAEPGGPRRGRLRRGRRPARGDGHRRGRRAGRVAATGPSYAGRGPSALLPNETATALAMVLTELLQNAVEHGYPDATSPARSGIDRVCVGSRARGRRRAAAGDRGRRRRRPAGRLRPRRLGQPRACRSCGPWWSPSSAGCWSCGPAPQNGARAVVDVPLERR